MSTTAQTPARKEIETTAQVAGQLRALESMTTRELAVKFHELYGFPARGHNKPYLKKRVAYRIQELAFGGLSQRALDRIEELAPLAPVRWREPAKRKDQVTREPNPPKNRSPNRDTRLPVPGSVITRIHEGVEHQVTVLDKGFEYHSHSHRSLSQIARLITGTPWNGYAFFGLSAPNRTQHEGRAE